MNVAQALIRRRRTDVAERSGVPLPFDAWTGLFGFGGLDYPFIKTTSTLSHEEKVDANFSGYVEGAYKRNGIVFACVAARMLIFSEARFRYQQLRDGRPGDLFGTADLDVLEQPWQNATTGDLLARMLVDADMAGNWFGRLRVDRRTGRRTIRRMRPDWVTIITGSENEDVAPNDTDVLGYVYEPGGPGSGKDPEVLLPEDVAHFAPLPDPTAEFRGMSWLTPVLREVMGDGAATNHKLQFFENGATVNLVVSIGDTEIGRDAFQLWVDAMEAQHAGLANAYKTLYLAAGADAKAVGSNLQQADFKTVQGAGETRIAAAARIPPVIVGLSEGLQGSSLNAGNYQAAKRAFADGTIRPLWRNASGSLASIVNVPNGARLWFDDRDVPFLREDMKDEAEIQGKEATTIRTLTDGGFTPESVIAAVTANDWKRLEHTGLLPVQQQEPGSDSTGSSNGNGSTPTPEETPA